MSGQSAAGPLALLVIIAVSDVWVYLDSTRRDEGRHPVVASVGSLTLETPPAWVVACLVLWIIFFPMYLVARSNRD